MPSEIVPTTTLSISRFSRLRLERKIGLRAWKTAQITIRPPMTGSTPRSPDLVRSMNPWIDPRSPSLRRRRSSCRSLGTVVALCSDVL